jgi:Terminase-like family.
MGTIGSNPNYSEVYLGIDIGQSQDSTAIVVADPELRDEEIHYLIRFLKRLPLGLPYPVIVEEIKRVYRNIPQTEGMTLNKQLWIDATGVGKPVVDLLREGIPELKHNRLHAVYLTGGEAAQQVDTLAREIKLPKAYLVSRLQVLISCGRVHLPNNAEAGVMREELMNYQIKVNDNANAQFGAFRVGTHDDLVTALGLACLCERATEMPQIASGRRREVPQMLRGYWD